MSEERSVRQRRSDALIVLTVLGGAALLLLILSAAINLLATPSTFGIFVGVMVVWVVLAVVGVLAAGRWIRGPRSEGC